MIAHQQLRLALAGFLALAGSSHAAIYTQDFEVDDTANWTTNDPGVTDTLVDYFYNYSAIGVPSAPGGTGTTGLRMTANNTNGTFGGFSVSPTGQNFTGDYRVNFDLWSNYVGPVGPGGSGTTQLSTYGLGTSGTVAVWPGSSGKESIMFATTLDGGSSVDYRAYSSLNDFNASATGVYSSGGGQNGSDPYYAGFGGDSAPAAQLLLFPGQTGTTDAGETAFDWFNVELLKIGDTVTWSINGLEINVVDASMVTLGGGNIFFGHSDTNNGSSTDPNDTLLNVTLIDNIRVEAIPEPSSVAFGLPALLLLALRRRR